ncbi:hypothetical protein V6N13_099734 [Hibiscus sabdariffa]
MTLYTHSSISPCSLLIELVSTLPSSSFTQFQMHPWSYAWLPLTCTPGLHLNQGAASFLHVLMLISAFSSLPIYPLQQIRKNSCEMVDGKRRKC